MNSNPLPPANLAALKGILGKSKAIMEKDISRPSQTRGKNQALPPRSEMNEMPEGMIASDQLIEAHQLPSNAPVYQEKPIPQMPQPSPHSTQPYSYNDTMVDNSNFSPEVKAAMKSQNFSIAAPQPFSLEDMGDLVEKPQQRINEQSQQSMNMNENVIRKIVQEELLKILGGEYTKKIRETTIKSTIQTLINEGKIKTTKRKVTRKA
jgi:hypothetical protein